MTRLLRSMRASSSSTGLREKPVALLVEREDPLRALLGRVLESAGYEVIDARDAGHAIAALSRFRGSVDLLLAEVTEPGIGGPRGLRESIPRSAHVVLTCWADSDACLAELDAGTTFFMANPFRNDALSRKLEELRNR